MNGMNAGALTGRPRTRAAITCPISCANSSPTNPAANTQPQMDAYTSKDSAMLPAVTATLPSFNPANSRNSSFMAVSEWARQADGRRRNSRLSATRPPPTARMPTLANFSANAASTASNPSFFAAATPINAISPYSAT